MIIQVVLNVSVPPDPPVTQTSVTVEDVVLGLDIVLYSFVPLKMPGIEYQFPEELAIYTKRIDRLSTSPFNSLKV